MNEDNKALDTADSGALSSGEPQHRDSDEAGTGRSALASIWMWLGIVVAVVMLGSVGYGVVKAESDMAARGRFASEKLAAARLEAKTGDYPQAWDSLQEAAQAVAADGPIEKLLGGSSAKRAEVRTAQENLAMEWVRNASTPEGHTFTEIADKAIGVLRTGLATAQGPRKADILAHVGWADFLKLRDGQEHLDPVALYRQAIAVDPTNPYANAFWGHYILWNHGKVLDAMEHFTAALSSGRDRTAVRDLELSGLSSDKTDEAEATWWQVVDEMRKGGEPINEDILNEMRGKYYFAFNGSDQDIARLFVALPPAEHVGLLRLLLKSPDNSTVSVKVALAITLEAAGKPQEALAAWRDANAAAGGQLDPDTEARMQAALKRLGGAATKK